MVMCRSHETLVMAGLQRVPVGQLDGAKEAVAKILTDWHFSVEVAESSGSEVWKLTKSVDGLNLELAIDPQAKKVSLNPSGDNKLSEVSYVDLEPGRITFLGTDGDCLFVPNDGSVRFLKASN